MNVQQMTDVELVQRYVSGHEPSLEVLINRHKTKVFNYIYHTVKTQELAEDIFQDTFIKVVKSLKQNKYQDNGKLLSWIMRIAHNLIIDHFRKEKQLKRVQADGKDLDIMNFKLLTEGNVEDAMVDIQIKQDIRKMVDVLPEDQKEVVVLRHFVGLSFKEIADMTGVSINTALGRMRYALINMRKMIDEKEIILNR